MVLQKSIGFLWFPTELAMSMPFVGHPSTRCISSLPVDVSPQRSRDPAFHYPLHGHKRTTCKLQSFKTPCFAPLPTFKTKKKMHRFYGQKKHRFFQQIVIFVFFFHRTHPSNYRCLNWSCKPIMGSTSSIVLKSLLVVTSNRPKCLVNQKIRALMEKILQLLG